MNKQDSNPTQPTRQSVEQCPVCHGHGLIDANDTTQTCPRCNGTGRITYIDPIPAIAMTPKLWKLLREVVSGDRTIISDSDYRDILVSLGYVINNREMSRRTGFPGCVTPTDAGRAAVAASASNDGEVRE